MCEDIFERLSKFEQENPKVVETMEIFEAAYNKYLESIKPNVTTTTVIQQRGRRISLSEARQMALQVLADTEKTIQEARLAEARFLMALWEED